ncbi:MAG: SAM-dependent methyltransferase [Dehalococcoidia bacterium]
MEPITLTPIGRVISAEREPARQDWSRVRSEVVLDGAPDLDAALLGLRDYSHVIVVGWLDQIPEALRERRQAYPSGDDRYPLQGALALRGARPNPISVTVCRLLGIEGATLRLEGLDLVDGTPVLDVKPYIAFYDAEPKATLPKWAGG